jgi:hypothetical protein
MGTPYQFPTVHEMTAREYEQQRDRVEHAQDIEQHPDVYADRPRDAVRFN